MAGVNISDVASWCGISFGDNYSNPLYYAEKLYLNGTLITSLVVPDGVTKIGDHAFYYCRCLTSVTIPKSVTQIGKYAFSDCDSLTSVNISDIASWCGISFGNDVANPLYYAKELYLNGALVTKLVIPDGVTKINKYAFYNCSGFTSVTIPNSVASIGDHAFYYCHNLTNVNISDVAAWCGISFGNDYANPLYYAKELYLNGTLATNLVISGGVTRINNYAFYKCNGFTSVTIGKSVTEIGNYAFRYGYNRENITDFKIYCYADTAGEKYAIDNGFEYELLSDTQSGDINGDGEVDSSDATAALKYDAGIADLTEEQLKAADINGDGAVDSADATMILKYDAGIIDEL